MVRGKTWPLSVAPMMDLTDRHCRVLLRQITRRTLLYSEMVTTGALLFGDRARHLEFSVVEKPLALQLGGDDPQALAACVRLAETWGYDEVNLNVGCPSERVQQGRFGACLMAEPELVAACVAAMREAVELPITVKHRIGIDDLDRYEELARFVGTVAAAGCDRFIVHACKAWLQGLSPKENRTIPPLRYGEVHRLKAELPQLRIEINGGIDTLEAAQQQLAVVDGVMVGRAAYQTPYRLALADRLFYGASEPAPTRREVVLGMIPYLEAMLAQGVYLSRITRHMLGLFSGQPGAKAWKRYLSEHAHRPGAGVGVLMAALAGVPEAVLDARPEALMVALKQH